MKAYAIHTVHYTDEKTGKVTEAPAKSVIQHISKADFDELAKLGAVRKPTNGEVADGSNDEHEDEVVVEPTPAKDTAKDKKKTGADSQSGTDSQTGSDGADTPSGASGADMLG